MPQKIVKKFDTLKAWSHSVYAQWVKCPLSVCFEKIQRIQIAEQRSPMLDYGSEIHLAAQNYVVMAKPPLLHKNLATRKILPILDRMRAAEAEVELKLAFTKDYKLTEWKDDNAWLRMIVDAMREKAKPPEVEVVDYKTGRIYPEEHHLQRELYALGALAMVDEGQLAGGNQKTKVLVSHVYVDGGAVATEEYAPKNLPLLKKDWAQRIKPMMTDTTFPAIIGRHCGYCKFAKSKGGPCPEEM
jgi:hypothetical protein